MSMMKYSSILLSMVQDSLKSPGLEVEDVQDEPHMPQDVVADEVH